MTCLVLSSYDMSCHVIDVEVVVCCMIMCAVVLFECGHSKSFGVSLTVTIVEGVEWSEVNCSVRQGARLKTNDRMKHRGVGRVSNELQNTKPNMAEHGVTLYSMAYCDLMRYSLKGSSSLFSTPSSFFSSFSQMSVVLDILLPHHLK